MAAGTLAGYNAAPTAAPVEAQVPPAGEAEFTCSACGDVFATAAEQRAHHKSERHLYNTKRRLHNLKPISQEAWERKLRESRQVVADAKGTAHLKPGKEPKKNRGSRANSEQSSECQATAEDKPEGMQEADEGEEEDEELKIHLTPCHCLFDRRVFKTVEACLSYMERNYNFFIPDREYCTDLEGLLTFLGVKISNPPHCCIGCNRSFPDMQSVRKHMIDKCHTRIGSEARTRRGHVDKDASDEMQAELEPFYDFHASTREITERMRKPSQKVGALVRYFDEDGDGYLNRKELATMWAAMAEGAELTDEQWYGACAVSGADPEEGLEAEELLKVYEAEVAGDLDAHWAVLQDLLTQKKAKKAEAKALKRIEEGDEEAAEDEDAEGGESEDEDEDSDEESVDIIECDDEDEFEEVMRILGLEPVQLLPGGDLRLPNGKVAAHRDMQYIYKQRGQRLDKGELVLAGNSRHPFTGSGRSTMPRQRAQLMLANAPAGSRIAMTQRQQARDDKTLFAILRKKERYEERRGMNQNLLIGKHRTKIRTGMGDMSGGR
eukprot:TRINITY_DN74432_c0_g1_i1.p1 TRINITY_DN74432_c0_g1~~TRINITY_DN74432_c0_g1_i1.p1  ORF type:complete len:550 (+),score=198.13 TRINITY_DN74432_c0_g1_i1:76-1725(+)